MPDSPAPLTAFLIALSHSSPLLQQFHAGELAPEDYGLSKDQMAVLREGNLEQIQAAVRAEHPDDAAVFAAVWIDIGKFPDWWIFGASSCESDCSESDSPESDADSDSLE